MQVSAMSGLDVTASGTEQADSIKPRYKSYKAPPLWRAKSKLQSCNHKWLGMFSRIQDSKIDNGYCMDSSFILYKIIRQERADMEMLGIKDVNEIIWLYMFGKMILGKWDCDNIYDCDFKQKIDGLYDLFIGGIKSEWLLEMIEWAIENKTHLMENWVVDYRDKGVELMYGNAYNSFFANVIFYSLDLLEQRGIDRNTIIPLAMEAVFPKFDKEMPVMDFASKDMDFRAIDILLRWSDDEPVVNMIKKQFDPSDIGHLFNNLWLVEVLMRYGHTADAKELVLKGNTNTVSILLDTAVKSYKTLTFMQQAEMRPLLHHLQRLVFE